MEKVSIGLRGWRFSESDVFDEEGRFRPLEEMPDDVANRVSRLSVLVTAPCDACYLVHGEENVGACNVAEVVYGEPMGEVILCGEHEADFVYWYRERGGDSLRGEPELRNAFHEWFADGGRAPGDYPGIEHVDTDPEHVPDPPDPDEVDFGEAGDLDLNAEYPSG